MLPAKRGDGGVPAVAERFVQWPPANSHVSLNEMIVIAGV